MAGMMAWGSAGVGREVTPSESEASGGSGCRPRTSFMEPGRQWKKRTKFRLSSDRSNGSGGSTGELNSS